MKTIILAETNCFQLVLKTYVDGSIKFIQRWEGMKELKDELFLTKEEVDVLRKEIN